MKYLLTCIHPPTGAARPGTARQRKMLSGWSALPGSASACVPAAVGQCTLAVLLRVAAFRMLWAAQVSPEDSGMVGRAGAGQC